MIGELSEGRELSDARIDQPYWHVLSSESKAHIFLAYSFSLALYTPYSLLAALVSPFLLESIRHPKPLPNTSRGLPRGASS